MVGLCKTKPYMLCETQEAWMTNTGNIHSKLPHWDLKDLYTSPESKALEIDLAKARKDAAAFHKNYFGLTLKLKPRETVHLTTAGVFHVEQEYYLQIGERILREYHTLFLQEIQFQFLLLNRK